MVNLLMCLPLLPKVCRARAGDLAGGSWDIAGKVYPERARHFYEILVLEGHVLLLLCRCCQAQSPMPQ